MLKIILAFMGKFQYPSEIDGLDNWIAKKKYIEIQEQFCAAHAKI